MKEITVTYRLDEDQIQTLEDILDLYKQLKPNSNSQMTIEDQFQFIMHWGCQHHINEQLQFVKENYEAHVKNICPIEEYEIGE